MKKILLLPLLFPTIAVGQTQHDRINSRGMSVFDALTNRTTILISNATPPVTADNVFKTNNAVPTTTTDFAGGANSQKITVNCGDTNTTIHKGTSNVTASGANISCALNQSATFNYAGGQAKWIQTAAGATPPAAASGDLQQKDTGGGFAASPLNDNGPKVTSPLPVQAPVLFNSSITTITGATPAVPGNNVFRTNNGGATTVTNFTGGTDRQQIQVICGDANTTIQNNSNIVTASGSDIICTTNLTQQFIFVSASSKWMQTGNSGGNVNLLGSNGGLQSTNGAAVQAGNINDNGTRVAIRRDTQFKGPNPWADIRAFGARSVGSAPQTTVNIRSGSANAKLASGASFQNGDGVSIPGAGVALSLSTPSAPSVTPSITKFGSGLNITVADGGTGATTYCYSIVARSIDGQLTPGSTETCTTTGQVTLGPVTPINISSYTRTGRGVTITTASAHTLVANAMVRITGADLSINGRWTVSSVPDNTHFVILTAGDSTDNAPASGGAVGTVTWYNVNHVSWSAVTNAYQYYIYGRVSGGTKTRIGTSYPQNTSFRGFPTHNTWDDYGTNMGAVPSAPPWVPSTVPAAGQNGILTTSIVSGGGTNSVVLANTAGNTVAGATFNFDNAPAINEAIAATSGLNHGVVHIPVGTFPTYAPVFAGTGSVVSVMLVGQLTLGDVFWLNDGLILSGRAVQNASGGGSFDWQALPKVLGTTAFPMIYVPIRNSVMSYVTLFNNSSNGMIYLQDSGGIPSSIFDHVQFHAGAGTDDFNGIAFMARGNTPTGGSSNWTFTDCTFVAELKNGTTSDTPIFYSSVTGMPYHLNNVQFALRGMSFDTGQNGAQIIIDNIYNQGPVMPLLNIFSTQTNGPGIQIENRGVIIDSAIHPFVNYHNFPTGSVSFSNVVATGNPMIVTGPGGLGVISRTQAANTGGVGFEAGPAFLNSVDGVNSQDNLFNPIKQYAAHLSLSPRSALFINSLATAAPTCSVSSGGRVALNTYQFVVAPVFATRAEGSPSPRSTSCSTVSGRQTVTVNWTAVPGAVGYNIYAPNVSQSLQAAGTSPFISGGATTSFIWTNQSVVGETVQAPGGGPTEVTRTGVYANNLVLPGLNGSAVNGTVTLDAPTATTARSAHFPDATGTLLLDSTITPAIPLQSFDTFNRANGLVNAGSPPVAYTVFNSPTISSNNVVGGSANQNNRASCAACAKTANQYSEVTFSNVGAGAAVAATVRDTGVSSATFYECVIASGGTTIAKNVSNAFTSLATDATARGAGDRIRCEVTGSAAPYTITAYVNGVQILTTTDSSIASGSPGFNIFSNGTQALDNFAAGDLAGTFPTTNIEQSWKQPQHFNAISVGNAPATGALASGLYLGSSSPLTSTSGNSGRVGQTSGMLTNGNLVSWDLNGNGVDSKVVAANVLTDSNAKSLTNKTLDAEGTGNVITIPFKPFVNAALCHAGTAGPAMNLPAASAPQVNCRTGRNVNEGTLDFADGDSAQFNYFLPSDWTGAIDARALFSDPDTRGTVIWQIATACTPVNGSATDDTAFNTADSFGTVTLGTTANGQWTATVTGITTTGCSAGNGIAFKVIRTRDTGTSRARLKGIELTVRRAM